MCIIKFVEALSNDVYDIYILELGVIWLYLTFVGRVECYDCVGVIRKEKFE